MEEAGPSFASCAESLTSVGSVAVTGLVFALRFAIVFSASPALIKRAVTLPLQGPARFCREPRSYDPGFSRGYLEPLRTGPEALRGDSRSCGLPQTDDLEKDDYKDEAYY